MQIRLSSDEARDVGNALAMYLRAIYAEDDRVGLTRAERYETAARIGAIRERMNAASEREWKKIMAEK